MNTKLILTLAILGVLVLGAIVFVVALNVSSHVAVLNQEVVSEDLQAVEYSTDYSYPANLAYGPGSACNPSNNYPCFEYPELEQIRLEPCPAPKPVCPLCREGLAQVQGEGHLDMPPQVLISC